MLAPGRVGSSCGSTGANMSARAAWRSIWAVDTEFIQPPGSRVERVVCFVAHDLISGETVRLFETELLQARRPPFPTGPEDLFVAYFVSAELSCFLTLGWAFPASIIDLFAEFRVETNGLPTVAGNSLLGACAHFGIDTMGAEDKSTMRDLILAGGPWSRSERQRILVYCQGDVDATARLFERMRPRIEARAHGVAHALLRGRYMAAVARMEHTGIPVDTALLRRLAAAWEGIKLDLIGEMDGARFGYDEGGHFRRELFAGYLHRNGIAWPRLASGELDLGRDAVRERAGAHPELTPFKQLRFDLGQLRLSDLPVGPDHRNRCLLSPFATKTGRNAPSSSRFLFGLPGWLRNLILPPEGYGVAYVDWAAQEYAIAARLSGDWRMIEAYESGDAYLAFCQQTGLAPEDATKESHPEIRAAGKVVQLGVLFGLAARGIADKIGRPFEDGRRLLELHRRTYPRFWRWSAGAVDRAMLTGVITTTFGWPLRVSGEAPNGRTIRNLPMQGNGAEMMRLAAIRATEAGLQIAAPVHDGFLLLAPVDHLEDHVDQLRAAMAWASRQVLAGYEIRTGVEQVVRHPDHFRVDHPLWDWVLGALERVETAERCSSMNTSEMVTNEHLSYIL
jgi:DNA polymerase I